MDKTAIASAMEKAGMPVAEARLRSLAHEALAKHHGNIDRALRTFETAALADMEAIRSLLRAYLENHRSLNFQPAGHRVVENHITGAGAAGGGGHTSSEIPRKVAVAEPSSTQRRASASVAKVVAITVLDTFKVRDGRAIGDVRFGEIDRLRSANAREASILKQVLNYAQASHDAKVRDVVPAAQLQRMIQSAAEATDAA